MNANKRKICIKFELSEADVDKLFAAGLDTPHKIKAAARNGKLPSGFSGKLKRWTK